MRVQTLVTSQVVKEPRQASTLNKKNSISVQAFRSVIGQSDRRMVGLGGLEPPASPLSGVRSNHLSYRPNEHIKLVELTGIEPVTPCLQSRCSPS